jgi:SAM-dependent methyltransferase
MRAHSAPELERIRRSRRNPSLTQFDYLHIRRLVDDLALVLARIVAPGARVLDVYCGSRPYDDLLPASAEVVGLDVVGNPYGIADVVSDEFLPFPDASFDVVMCIQAFDYIADPIAAVGELERVLRPGGWVLLTVPFVWEYDRTTLVHRYTGPELAALLRGWEDVEIIENGGRAVAWTTLSASLASILQGRLSRGETAGRIARPLFDALYALVNVLGFGLDAAERRYARGSQTLPMNLLVSARRAAPSTPRAA